MVAVVIKLLLWLCVVFVTRNSFTDVVGTLLMSDLDVSHLSLLAELLHSKLARSLRRTLLCTL